MPSALDVRMDNGIGNLTGEGAPMATTPITVRGQTYPSIASAPPSLAHYFAHFCDLHKDETFLVAGDERLTFGQMHDQAGRVAQWLVGEGVGRGDRIGIAMRNSPSWIALYMGILMAGGTAVLLNGWWQSEEFAAALTEVECSIVFACPPRARRLEEVQGLTARIAEIADLEPIAVALAPVTADTEIALPELGPDDLATILFTSGSTGQSKGALSDHRAILQAVLNYLAQALVILGISTEDGKPPEGQPSTLLNVPLFHVTAEVPVMLQSFAMGRKLVMMPKWDAEVAMRLIEKERISYFVGVPLMSFEILTHPNRGQYDLSSVTDFAAGGAPRPVDHVRRFNEEMQGAPLIGYGLTETNGVGCGNWRSNYLAKPNSTGRASAPLVDLAIMAGDGVTKLPANERGEVAIRSIANFREYWHRPEATAAAFNKDGYFLTGDIGYLDEDGYLFIVDRKKDIIIRGGENISCQEVEAAIYEHPLIAEAAVFGLADERFGEVPGAVVHFHDGDTVSEADLQDFLRAHIAAFKVPARIWTAADPLPRLGTEKIDKVGLRAKYRALAAAG